MVKKKMRILSLLLTALMVIGLGGCGSTDNSIENTAPQNSTISMMPYRGRSSRPRMT